jgi:hypothetical protein
MSIEFSKSDLKFLRACGIDPAPEISSETNPAPAPGANHAHPTCAASAAQLFSAADMQRRWEKIKAAGAPPLADVLKIVRDEDHEQ